MVAFIYDVNRNINMQNFTSNPGVLNLPVTGTGPYALILDYNVTGDQTQGSFHVGDSTYNYGGCTFNYASMGISTSTYVGTLNFDTTNKIFGVAGIASYTVSQISPASNTVLTISMYADAGYTQRLNTNTDYQGNNNKLYELPQFGACTSRTVYVRAFAHDKTLPGCGGGFLPCPGGNYFEGSFTTSTVGNQGITFGDTLTYPYKTQWGALGSGNGQFNSAFGVAADSSGNVYVDENNVNYRVQKFDSAGNYQTQWGSLGSGNGQFNGTDGIAVDTSGNVYVADGAHSGVQKFTPTGGYLTQWGGVGTGNGQFNNPQGVATDSSGNVYVVDAGNSRVQKFTSIGGYLTQWGTSGSGNSQFNTPHGVAVDSSGNVYVADGSNNRVQKFDSIGGYLTQWGILGTGNGQFNVPAFIAVDSSGKVYVTDLSNNRVQKFDSNGNYLSQWGTLGSGNGQLNQPLGIAVDSSGNVFVVDRNNNRIQVFTP